MLKQFYEKDKIEVGLDEAGRGCLFGPVFVAAVIWLDKDPNETKEYILKDSKNFDIILIATGSEIGISMNAAEDLEKKGIKVRVISMPSTEIFEKQEDDYKESVLPSNFDCKLAVEAGSTSFWYKYVGSKGDIIGINSFGESAPGDKLLDYFGFSSENIVQRAEMLLKK